MVAVTHGEISTSLAAFRELRYEGQRLYFAEPGVKTIRIDLRVKEPHHLVALARSVAHLGHEEADFRGAHLWLTTWGVWDPQVEAIGRETLQQFRRGQGENRSLELAPGHIFGHDEFTEAVCCLLQPMIVGWDAYYVPRWAFGDLDYFVAVSHDAFLDIEVRTQEMHERALTTLGSYAWTEGLLNAEN